jgi:23S rRNA (guanosine2251-2'-O)-methyltransferase
LNLRSPKTSELQSDAFDRSAIPPLLPYFYCNEYNKLRSLKKRYFAFNVKCAIVVSAMKYKKHTENATRPNKKSHKGARDDHSPRHQARPNKNREQTSTQGKPKLPQRPMLYGFHAVCAAWRNPERSIQALYATEAGLKSFEETLADTQRASANHPAPQIVDKQTLENALPQGAVHQGLALACHDLPESSVQDFIIESDARDHGVYLVLDQVTDPHNVGAIMRSACAFGANGLIMQRRHAPERHGVLAKTACGAVEHVPVAQETNLSRAIEELQEAGFIVIGLDERGEHPIQNWSAPFKYKPTKIALVLGAEGPGLRPLVRDHCDSLVHLPTSGELSSLNVSNAAAVSLFALTQS